MEKYFAKSTSYVTVLKTV